jgi:DHA1 family tetracycline resistance protein-like MFS transporter
MPAIRAAPSVRWASALIALIVFVDFLGFALVLPFLPIYAQQAFGASALVIGLIVATYPFCQLFAAPVLGRLSDQHGRRPVLLITMLGSALGFLVLASAQWVSDALAVSNPQTAEVAGVALLFLARAINGLTGGNMPVAQAYLADVTPPDRRAQAMGAITTASVLALGIGPLLSGFLSAGGDFAKPAVLAAVASLISAALCWLFLPEQRSGPAADLPPGSRITSWTAETELPPPPMTPRWSAIGPLIRRPAIGGLLQQWFLFILCFGMVAPMFPLIASTYFGLGTLAIGILFTLLAGLAVVWQLFILGPLSRRMGDRNLAVLGLDAFLVCFVLATLSGERVAGGQVPLAALVTGVALFGIGFAAARPALPSAMTTSVGPAAAGSVMGVAQSLDSLAYLIGPVLTGWLLDARGLTAVMATAATCSAAALVIGVREARRPPPGAP